MNEKDAHRIFRTYYDTRKIEIKIAMRALEEKMNDTEKIAAIAYFYGTDNQLGQTTEEAAELIQAISKYNRAPAGGRSHEIDHIAEEIADVEIMLKQLKILLNLDEKVDVWKQAKINRQIARMNHGTSL